MNSKMDRQTDREMKRQRTDRQRDGKREQQRDGKTEGQKDRAILNESLLSFSPSLLFSFNGVKKILESFFMKKYFV